MNAEQRRLEGKDSFVKVLPLAEYEALLARLNAQAAIVEAALAFLEDDTWSSDEDFGAVAWPIPLIERFNELRDSVRALDKHDAGQG